jgi:hypothetical protein
MAGLGVVTTFVSSSAPAAEPNPKPQQTTAASTPSDPASPPPQGPAVTVSPQNGPDNQAQVTSLALEAAAIRLVEASAKLQTAAAQLEKSSIPPPEEDDDRPLIKGRLPWNGAFFTVSEKQKRAIVSASIPLLDGAWSFKWSASAPLDEKTRQVALLDPTELIPFRVGLAIEYNAMTNALQNALERGVHKAASKSCRAFWQSKAGQIDERGMRPGCPDGTEYRTWKAAQEDSTLARPDGMLGRAVPAGALWNLGLDVDAAYERTSVFRDDLSESPSEESTYDVNIDLAFTHYPKTWLALPLRVGANINDRIRASTITRCQTLDSSDPTISGQSCGDVQWITADPGPEATAHVEIAAVVVPSGLLGDVQGGFEVRDRVESLGGTALNRFSLGVFVSPTSAPVVSRFGIALEYRTALDDAPGVFESGDSWLVPTLLVGASL